MEERKALARYIHDVAVAAANVATEEFPGSNLAGRLVLAGRAALWYTLFVGPTYPDPTWTPRTVNVYMGIKPDDSVDCKTFVIRIAERVLKELGGTWKRSSEALIEDGYATFRSAAGRRVCFIFCNESPDPRVAEGVSWCHSCLYRHCPAARTHRFTDGVLRSMRWTPPKVALLGVVRNEAQTNHWFVHGILKLGAEFTPLATPV